MWHSMQSQTSPVAVRSNPIWDFAGPRPDVVCVSNMPQRPCTRRPKAERACQRFLLEASSWRKPQHTWRGPALIDLMCIVGTCVWLMTHDKRIHTTSTTIHRRRRK